MALLALVGDGDALYLEVYHRGAPLPFRPDRPDKANSATLQDNLLKEEMLRCESVVGNAHQPKPDALHRRQHSAFSVTSAAACKRTFEDRRPVPEPAPLSAQKNRHSYSSN